MQDSVRRRLSLEATNGSETDPEGYHSVTPYVILHCAVAALDFYKRAFDAVEMTRMTGPDGRIGYAEIKIGDSHIMLADDEEMRKRAQAAVDSAASGG